MSSKSKTFREEKRKNQKATGIGFLVIFALCATFFVVKFFVGMLPVTLTEQERIQIENTVLRELKSERKKVQERMDHRASIGGLYDQIGSTSRETWAQLNFENARGGWGRVFVTPESRRIRRAANRWRPYGDEKWVIRTARRLGLESTLRNRGRPKKVK